MTSDSGPRQLQRTEEAGVDLNKLRLFLRDGIGDQVGLHMHDAPRLLDSDLSGLFGGERAPGWPGSGCSPVRVRRVVGLDPGQGREGRGRVSRRNGQAPPGPAEGHRGAGLLWRQEVDFYRVQFPKPHTIRCLVVNIVGLKWRLYWGRIGDGLYVATRPFILEDLAAAQADGKKPAKTDPAHAVLRVRPENWNAVLPGYNLGWAEANRAACHANLDMAGERDPRVERPAAGGTPTPYCSAASAGVRGAAVTARTAAHTASRPTGGRAGAASTAGTTTRTSRPGRPRRVRPGGS